MCEMGKGRFTIRNILLAAIKGTKQGGMQTEDAERRMPHVKRSPFSFFFTLLMQPSNLQSGACSLLCGLADTGTRNLAFLRWAP